MSESLIAAIIAAIPPTLVAWAALRASRRNGVKADLIIGRTTDIYDVTNSQLAKVMVQLDAAVAKTEALQSQIKTLETTIIAIQKKK